MNYKCLPSKPTHQLITIDSQKQILHYQKCKIIINKIAKCLIFEPEESKILSATFDKTFFQLKNYICIFDLDSSGFNFILILSNEKNAKTIFDSVQNGNINDISFMSHQHFMNKFMLPICNRIQSNNFIKNGLQKLLFKFNKLFDSKQKQKFMDLCKNGSIDISLFKKFVSKQRPKIRLHSRKSKNGNKSDGNFDPNEMKNSSDESYKTEDSDYERPPSKRRKTSNDKNVKEKPKLPYKRKPTKYRKFDNIYTADQILRKSDYKLVTTGDLNNPKQRLIIFSPSNKELCYEYFFSNFSKLFYCIGCHGQKHTTAYIKKINGEECIKMNSMNHICELRPYLPEKYSFDPEKQIIESPNFEVYVYQQKNEKKKNLVIFDSKGARKLCYEYYWNNKYNAFLCCGCKVKNFQVRAIVCNKLNGMDYVKLSRKEHICDMRVYKPEKFQSDLIYQKSDYEIIEQIKYGITSKRLFLFTSAEKTHCYIFGFNEELEKSSYYYCTKCQHRHIQAYICHDENGEEFLSVRNKQHLCEPIEYQPQKYCNNKIIKKPNYQLAKKQSRKIIMSKLLIFTSIDKNYCYEYSWRDHHNAYQCSVCEHRFKHFVIARIINPGGTEKEEYVELSKNEHKCEPVKYEPRNYEIKIVEALNFEIKTTLKYGKKVENLYIYDSENRQLSYKYYYISARRCWCCCGCIIGKEAKRISITATIQKNEKGEDFVQLGPRDHVCKPQKN